MSERNGNGSVGSMPWIADITNNHIPIQYDDAEPFCETSRVEYDTLVSLNNKLSKIETVVSECEREIKDREISASIIVSQIENITNPAAQIAKGKEWIDVLLGKVDKLNILRLKELKHQHPNNFRINELGRRVVNCYMALSEINFSVSETLVSPDMKPAIQANNQKMREGIESLYGLFEETIQIERNMNIFIAATIGTVQDVEFFLEKILSRVNVQFTKNIQNCGMSMKMAFNKLI